MSYFNELGLAEPILRALNAKGYDDPTPIQRQAIPALLEGRDLLGIAQTGTGKTAAFSLPSLHRLVKSGQPRKPASCRMLVLSPTRELTAQIAENMRGYAKYLDLTVQVVFGGVPVPKQARALVPGTDILVATPGRLLDLIEQRALTLRNVEIFVLDEADQMMDLGFIKPLTHIAKLLPAERQSLFFSATMPQAIADLGKRFINNPVKVEVAPQSTTAERVEQFATFVDQREKQALLTIRLREAIASGALDRALVFTRTKHGADRVARHLAAANISAAAIHGNKSQGQRTAALQGFRKGAVQVLVATDIAARGIDVSGVSHVFNFELPNVAEQYVHRIGRTARNGADGLALSFVAPDEKPYLRDIEKLTRVKLTVVPLPEDFVVEARRLPLPSKKAVEEAIGDSGGRRMGRGRPGEGQPRRERSDRGERPRRDDRREAGAGEGRPERTLRADRPAPRDGFQRRSPDDCGGERPFRGDRPARDGQRYGQGNGGRAHEGRGPARRDQISSNYDPLAAYAEKPAANGGEPLPKRLRAGAGAGAPETRNYAGRSEGDRGQNQGQRPRRFGGGDRPQGSQGGGRRSSAGRSN